LFLLFSKYLPVINMAEVKAVIRSTSADLPRKIAGVAKVRAEAPVYDKDKE
jgi:molybdopterin-containing oxidoreductase family membrane subunit